MEYFIQQLINGLTLGGLYALIALGYTMVYGVIQLINFAHGEFFAAGGYMGVILLSYFAGLGYMETHPWICLLAALDAWLPLVLLLALTQGITLLKKVLQHTLNLRRMDRGEAPR